MPIRHYVPRQAIYIRTQNMVNDVASMIVHDAREVTPASILDLKVGEVDLPHVIKSCGLLGKLVTSPNHIMIKAAKK